jgi:hypothetical protein
VLVRRDQLRTYAQLSGTYSPCRADAKPQSKGNIKITNISGAKPLSINELDHDGNSSQDSCGATAMQLALAPTQGADFRFYDETVRSNVSSAGSMVPTSIDPHAPHLKL